MLRYTLTVLLLLAASPALAQQEMRSSTKGASTPLPITGSSIDADHNALDVKCLSGCTGGAGGGGTSATDDAAFAPGTDAVTPAGFMFDDVAPDSVNEGDIGVGRMSANRNLYVNIRDNAGNERGLNIDANGALAIGSVPTNPFGANADAASATGSISAKLRFIASTGIPITGTVTVGSHAVTNAGTFATQPAGSVAHDAVGTGVNPVLVGGYSSAAAPADVSADGDAVRTWHLRNGSGVVNLASGGTLITVGQKAMASSLPVVIASDQASIPTAGNVAHDAVDSGNPTKVGGKAIAHGTNPTAVAAADRTDWYFNRAGVPFVIGGHPNSKTIEAQVEDADGAQTNAAIVTVAAGNKIVVTRLTASCDAGNTGPINAVVGFGTASIPARAHTGSVGVLHGFDGIPAGGGFTIGDGHGILGIGADDEDLRLTMEDPAGGSCSVSATYYTIES